MPHNQVINGLNELIMHSLKCYESESTHPQLDSDASDAKIEFYTQRIKNLRVIRDAVENEMARVY